MKKIFLKFHIILLLISSSVLFAQDDFTVLARWGWGSCNAVVANDETAFIANGSCLTKLDISNHVAPVDVSSIILDGEVLDIAVEGSYAYLAIRWLGLQIVDLSDPNNMTILGTGETYNNPQKVFYADGLAYIIEPQGGVMIFDVSDPSNPEYKAQIFASGFSQVSVESDYLFVANETSGLIIYNISDSSNPVVTGFLPGNYFGQSITTSGNFAYLGTTAGLKIVDITDKANPTEVGTIDGNIICVYLNDNTLYTLDRFGGLKIINVSSPTSPSIIAELAAGYFNSPKDISVYGDYIFVCENGLIILDASNPSEISQLSKFNTASYSTEIIVEDNYVYLADLSNGLFILEVETKSKVQRIGMFVPDVQIKNFGAIAVSENTACLGSFYGMYVLDITDLSNPILTGELATGSIGDIEIIGNYAYLALGTELSVIDISDPNNLHEVASLEETASDICVEGNYAYVINGSEDGFNIIDVSDPANPQVTAFAPLQNINFIRDIFVYGNYAFTCGHGLNITDVSDPNNPTIIGHLNGSFWYSVTANNDDVYIGGEDGIFRIDISDLTNPVWTGFYYPPGSYTGQIAFSNDVIYFSQAYNGLYLFEDNFPTDVEEGITPLPHEFNLTQNYPNPFNPSTSISYAIPEKGFVNLTVYDLLGRKIADLVNEEQAPGNYKIEYNSTELTTGIYFYTLRAGNKTETKKMILLR